MYVDMKTLCKRLDRLTDDELHFVRFMSGGAHELIPYAIMYLEKKRTTFNEWDRRSPTYVKFLRCDIPFTTNQWNLLRNVCRTVLPEFADSAYGVMIAQNYLEPRQQGNLNSAKSTNLRANIQFDEKNDEEGGADSGVRGEDESFENTKSGGGGFVYPGESGQEICTLSNYPNAECLARCRQCVDTIKEVGVLGSKGKPTMTIVTSFMLEFELVDCAETSAWLHAEVKSNYTSTKMLYDKLYELTKANVLGSELREISWRVEKTTTTTTADNEATATAAIKSVLVRMFVLVFTPGVCPYANYRTQLLDDEGGKKIARNHFPRDCFKLHRVYELFSSAKTIVDLNDCSVVVHNFAMCLYCCITGRYKPDYDSVMEGFLFTKMFIISLVMFCGGSTSIKRNGLVMAGYGPVIIACVESGFYEMERHLLNYPTAMSFKLHSAIEEFLVNKPQSFGVTSPNICMQTVQTYRDS